MRQGLICLLLVLAGAVICCAGLLSVSISNDSVYYYSTYPSMLVKMGRCTASMDIFLTNVGQSSAAINCLPFFLGFDESFGIQHFLNLNFILIFFRFAVDFGRRKGLSRRGCLLAGAAATLILLTSEPFLVLSKWVLSNAYFMIFLFLVCALADRVEEKDFLILEGIFLAMLSLVRMEGGAVAAVVILAISCRKVPRKTLILSGILPLFLTQALYYAMLYIGVGADPLYSFQDWRKAALMLSGILALFLYFAFIRSHISDRLVPFLFLGVLIVGNLGLCLMNRDRYLGNLKAFLQNLRQGNGWGYTGLFFLFLVIFAALDLIRKKRISYWEILTSALILTILAASFARGGALAVRTSDSGNRALLQIFPVLFYTLYRKGLNLILREQS